MILNVADIAMPMSTISESEYIFFFYCSALSPAWSVREEEVVLVGVRWVGVYNLCVNYNLDVKLVSSQAWSSGLTEL